MAIDFDNFVHWAEDRFDDIIVKGSEVKINSIFADDQKHHMWCNPHGGKKNHKNGVFHCWKTDKSGSLVSLVMLIDSCDYQEAMEILGGVDTTLEELEKRIEEIFNNKEEVIKEIVPGDVGLKLPPLTYELEKLDPSSYHRVQAEVYLFERSLPITKLMICVGGDYKNRIVIPYYDDKGNLIYYNCRFLGDSKLRYLGPPKEVGIGKSDVLYVPKWPEKGSKLYLCEGEFDSLSLFECKLPSGAFGGKELSERHISYLLAGNYKPVLCVDSDKYGRAALSKMGKSLLEKGVEYIGYVRPPKSYKDWNEMLNKVGPKIVHSYVTNREKELDLTQSINLEIENLL
ncbi:MAG: toprim domain-containing protein [Candidatus Thorarchaeota archaeon]|jgi:hypothetical protein